MLFSIPSYLFFLASITLLFSTSVIAYKPLSDSFLRAIPSPGQDIDPQNGAHLAPILIPRVPGTPGQEKVQHHFVNFFQTELPKWTMEWQNSTSRTPISGGTELPFANLIFRREPPWVKPGQSNLLTLVAHYDSKYQPEGFIGATDSAAPCAMLMYVAKVIDGYVQKMYDEMQELGEGGTVEMDMGVQILLLDGEEAFDQWTDEDSLYGSRFVLLLLTLSTKRPNGSIEIRKKKTNSMQSTCKTMVSFAKPTFSEILQVPHTSQPNFTLRSARPIRRQ